MIAGQCTGELFSTPVVVLVCRTLGESAAGEALIEPGLMEAPGKVFGASTGLPLLTSRTEIGCHAIAARVLSTWQSAAQAPTGSRE